MADVITVVGAGGKTGLIEALATKYAALGKRVAVTTTTHILCRPDRPGVTYFGRIEGGKRTYPGDDEYETICRESDVVLVEGDGSHHRPIKIPADYEPVIPFNTKEILVVMGLCAVGRPFEVVCHRACLADPEDRRMVNGEGKSATEPETLWEAETSTVTEEFIDYLAQKYYMRPLEKRYPKAKIRLIRSDMARRQYVEYAKDGGIEKNTGWAIPAPDSGEKPVRKLAFILMASGYGRRFGGNKLLYSYQGKQLYRWTLDALLEAKALLEDNDAWGVGKDGRQIQVETIVVSRYDEILNENDYIGVVRMVNNPDYAEGIAGSVRVGARTAFTEDSCDAAAFFVADQPHLDGKEIARFLKEYLCSGKRMGCMFTDHPGNPAVFRREMKQKLLSLTGDAGGGKLLRAEPEKVHYYVVDAAKLMDMDCPLEESC